MSSVTWAEAADLLETFLEEAGRLIDGEEVPDGPEFEGLELIGTPEPHDVDRVRILLAQAEEAMQAMALRRAEIQHELDHTAKLRTAGAGYLRYQ